MSATVAECRRCRTALCEGDHRLESRYDKIDLPPVRPIVTRVERDRRPCPCCGDTTLAPVPDGSEEELVGPSIVAMAL